MSTRVSVEIGVALLFGRHGSIIIQISYCVSTGVRRKLIQTTKSGTKVNGVQCLTG